MRNDFSLSSADTADDLERLRVFVAAGGAAATAGLDKHLARPRYRPAFTRMAERAGQISGYALLGHERLRLGAATLECGRLAALDAGQDDPGLFTTLLGDCLRVLAEEGLALALPHGSLDKYGPFGFAEYCLDSTVKCWDPDQHQGDQLRPALEADLEDITALYEASYSRLPLTQIRAAPDWRHWLASQRAVWGLEDTRGRLVAYAAIEARAPDEPRAALEIDEAGAADAGAARSLCLMLLRQAQEQDNALLLLRLSPWHVVAQAALQLQGQITLAAPQPVSDMQLAGVVDLPMLLEALAPELERRLELSRYAGWSGNLRLELETERIVVAFAEGRASVIDGSRPADLRLRRINLPGLAQLCLGYRAAADLRATGGLDCDDAALGLLDALFPVVFATK
ncbi:MAG TPA: sterol carrier protein domain-containing protein [Roseiflexaceae bacterium]|nr:sterol carrier protein domain-containing protein [Roseiflexaceae bacterium]